MENKGFADNQSSIETPSDAGITEKPLKSGKISSNRVDINVLKSKNIDIYCHHGCYTASHISSKFSLQKSIEENTNNIEECIYTLKEKGCKSIVLTGSYFQRRFSGSSDVNSEFSLYAVSKNITFDIFKYWCSKYGINLHHFIMPNPIGYLDNY